MRTNAEIDFEIMAFELEQAAAHIRARANHANHVFAERIETLAKEMRNEVALERRCTHLRIVR
jgi:hypothetical protein